MNIFFSITLFLLAAVSLSACKSDQSSDSTELFLPVSAENALLCEASHSYDHVTLLPLLDSLLSSNVNAVCVPVPTAGNRSSFKGFMDSCHQRGLTVILHAHQLQEADTALVKTFDVDGFHFSQTIASAKDDWSGRLDALYRDKTLLVVADSLAPSMQDVGFSAFKSKAFENALVEVVTNNQSLSLLDSALAFEGKAFAKEARILRMLPENLSPSTDVKQQEAFLMVTFGLTGLPVCTPEMLVRFPEFLRKFNTMYVNSPAMQYGTVEGVEREANGVYIMVRVHQDERVLIAVNLRDRKQSYEWPSNLSRSNTEYLLGEPLAMSGGQELPAFGYQVLRFKYLEGMQPLDMDYAP